MRPPVAALLACALLVPWPSGAAPAETPQWVGMPEKRELSDRDRVRIARNLLEKARALRQRGEIEAAEATLGRAVTLRPRWAPLHRERARILDDAGRDSAARRARERADQIAPPPGPLPDETLAAAADIAVVLLPPAPDAKPERRPRNWPAGEIAEEIERRLATRLPVARIAHADFSQVATARRFLASSAAPRVLSLRVERVYCGDNTKDGRFGLAQIRVATHAASGGTRLPAVVRVVLDEPRLAIGCRRESVARALERALALPQVVELLELRDSAHEQATAHGVRGLFPQIDAEIEARLTEGLGHLAAGRMARALTAFQSASAADPDDPIAASYVRDVTETLQLSRELARRRGEDGDTLPARLGPAQRAAIESQLATERTRRDQLLAALSALEESARVPAAEALRGLVPVVARPGAFALKLAEQRTGGSVSVRAAMAPDGSELARYYFAPRDPLPVLRAEDSDADGQPDRWIGYAGTRRAEIWEDARDAGHPDVRLVLAPDGKRLTRAEYDRDGNGHPERVLHYESGKLRAQAVDADADGRFETVDRFEANGRIRVRDEDVDGDGTFDIRSRYEGGKLVRRELNDPGLPGG